VSSPESRRNAVTTADGYVPVINMGRGYNGSADQLAVAEAVALACRSSGFFMVTGHRVPAAAIERVLASSATFFGLPQQEKMAVVADPSDPLMRGFSWPARPREDGKEAALFVPPDLSESYVINCYGNSDEAPVLPAGADSRLLLPNKIPSVPGFKDSYRAYYAQMERLAMEIMQLFALALGLPADWFNDKFDRHMTSLSVNYYPAQENPPADRRQLRKAAHTDWGTLTILYQEEGRTGLQVWSKRDGWVDIPSVPGALVVNIGDLMARWTGDDWSSTVHRVVNPPPAEAGQARYSFAFFHQPNHDAIIECIPSCEDPQKGPKYRPIRSFEYISAKARRAYLEERVLSRKQTPGRFADS
jgi:isopenicillin N synthase-like dioxygenase